MSFEISEEYYPVLDWKGCTPTQESPKVISKSWIVARWDMTQHSELPTMDDVHEAVHEMRGQYPGREKDYRILGLPGPGDFLFGVEVA